MAELLMECEEEELEPWQQQDKDREDEEDDDEPIFVREFVSSKTTSTGKNSYYVLTKNIFVVSSSKYCNRNYKYCKHSLIYSYNHEFLFNSWLLFLPCVFNQFGL